MRAKDIGMLAVCMTACLAGSAWGDQVVLSASKDNTLYEDELGQISNGSGEHLFVGVPLNPFLRRGLIAFDLSSIPAGSTITGVTLRMRMSRTIAGSVPITLHRVEADWGEGASNAPGQEGGGTTALAGDATWLHTFYNGSFWTNMGGDFAAAASATTSVAGVGFYTWTGAGVVADVQAWVNGDEPNYGWLMKTDELDNPTAKRFDSSENLTPANRPTLTVDFTPPVVDCPADCDGNGTVNAADVGCFLSLYFEDLANGTLVSDCDGNQVINAVDVGCFLNLYFASLGPCP